MNKNGIAQTPTPECLHASFVRESDPLLDSALDLKDASYKVKHFSSLTNDIHGDGHPH